MSLLSIPPQHVQLFHRHLPCYEILITANPFISGLMHVQILCCGEEYVFDTRVNENDHPVEAIKKVITDSQLHIGQILMLNKQAMQEVGLYVH